jgi:hypothetical protein
LKAYSGSGQGTLSSQGKLNQSRLQHIVDWMDQRQGKKNPAYSTSYNAAQEAT